MTIGIYSLYWEEQDLIYIGQSQNIEKRFKEHLNDLSKTKHSNYKVQNAFNNHGIPTLNILEKCSINQLNDLEIVWQKEFDSLNSLDLVEAGQVGYGTNSNASIYSKRQILKVFSCLYKGNFLSQKSISEYCKVNIRLPSDIYSGRTHTWLKEVYPTKYAAMKCIKYKNIASSGISLGNKYQNIISPTGKIYKVTIGIKYFVDTTEELNKYTSEVARIGISRIQSGTLKSWNGWKIQK